MRFSSTTALLAVLGSSNVFASDRAEQPQVRLNLRGDQPRNLEHKEKDGAGVNKFETANFARCWCKGWVTVPPNLCINGYVNILGMDCGTKPAATGATIGTPTGVNPGTPTGTDPDTPTGTNPSNASPVYDTIIVGAGWSGLKAAESLIDKGYKVLVLEARDRVGGRSHTDNDIVPDSSIEYGSEWLYTDGTMVDSIEGYGITYATTEVSDDLIGVWSPFTLNESKNIGTMLEPTVARELMDNLWGDYVKYVNERVKEISKVNGPLGDADYQEILQEYLARNQYLETNGYNFERQYLNAMMEFNIDLEYAAENHEVSATLTSGWLGCAYEWAYLAVPGGGYGNAARNLANRFGDNIQLKSVVKEIKYSQEPTEFDAVEVSYQEDGGVFKEATAKTVLVTVPLGVLKEKTITFTPPLPQYKEKVINEMKYGTLNKAILYWEDPFVPVWPMDKEWLVVMTQSDEDSGTWTSFYNPYVLNGGRAVLTAWIGGEKAEAVEDQEDADILDQVMTNLRSMFGFVQNPTDFRVTRWKKDEFSRGSYSVMQEGYNFYEQAEQLSQPVGNLYFAGEATAQDGWSATVEGAYQSGEKAANTIEGDLK